LDLIDLHANGLLKDKLREGKLVEFYLCLPDVEFPKLKIFAAGMVLVFGTTYVWKKQTFSKMECVKLTHRTRLTNKYLVAIFLIGCSHSKPKVLDILKAKRLFHKSHYIWLTGRMDV
jgi:hypothetical protein